MSGVSGTTRSSALSAEYRQQKLQESYRQRVRQQLDLERQATASALTQPLFFGSISPNKGHTRATGESGPLEFLEVKMATQGFRQTAVPKDGVYNIVGRFRVRQKSGESFISPRFVIKVGEKFYEGAEHNWLLMNVEKGLFVDELVVEDVVRIKRGQRVEIVWMNLCPVGASVAELDTGTLRIQFLSD